MDVLSQPISVQQLKRCLRFTNRVAFRSITLACHLALPNFGVLRTVKNPWKLFASLRTIAKLFICRAVYKRHRSGAIRVSWLNIKVDQAAEIDGGTRDTRN